MYNDKRFFAVIALVVGLACVSVKALTVQNAIPDSSLVAVRTQLGNATTIDAWNTALAGVNNLISKAATTSDMTNVLGLFDTGAINIGSVLTNTAKTNLCYSQPAYDAVSASVKIMAGRFGSAFSPKLSQNVSGNLYSKFARALIAPLPVQFRSR